MKTKEVLALLKSKADDARRKHNAKVGPDGIAPPKNQYGVPMGEIRAIAKKIKTDHELALALWDTGNMEAQLVAALIIKPKSLTAKEVDGLTRSTTCAQVADWLSSYVISVHPDKDALREKWMKDKNPWAARAGWHFTASKINKAAKGKDADALDVESLLNRIEKELAKAKPEVQWTMNNTLMAIGIKHAALRKRAIAIGQKVGLYKNWPVSKGCIIPYVPVAVEALVKRKG